MIQNLEHSNTKPYLVKGSKFRVYITWNLYYVYNRGLHGSVFGSGKRFFVNYGSLLDWARLFVKWLTFAGISVNIKLGKSLHETRYFRYIELLTQIVLFFFV